jgi:hypothetical protein
MKKFGVILFSLLFFSVGIQVRAGTEVSAETLLSGQCYSAPDVKYYLANIKGHESSYSKLVSEIGAQKIASLQNTPSEIYYFCKAFCKSHKGEVETRTRYLN